jgi:alanine racemase
MSTNLNARAWVQVQAEALRENYTRIAESVGPGPRVLPMVKADAYGLGVDRVITHLETLNPWGYGVATVEEGRFVRGLGVKRPIVVCSPTPIGEFSRAIDAELELSISSLTALARANDAARAAGRVARIHIEVDTGMGRSGFDWRTREEWLPALLAGRSHTEWVGCYTHLHSADTDPASVEEQWARLSEVLTGLEELPETPMVHLLNSAGVFRAPGLAKSLVRPGIFLYGGEVGMGQPTPEAVVSVHARVVHISDVPVGTTLGYGATYRAQTEERWATLSIGYGDGLPRALGNRGSALLGGRRVPVIGRISMDVTVVNITDVPEVEEGSVATLIGRVGDETITVDEVAGLAGTISYEIFTGLTARLPRVWSDEGA